MAWWPLCRVVGQVDQRLRHGVRLVAHVGKLQVAFGQAVARAQGVQRIVVKMNLAGTQGNAVDYPVGPELGDMPSDATEKIGPDAFHHRRIGAYPGQQPILDKRAA